MSRRSLEEKLGRNIPYLYRWVNRLMGQQIGSVTIADDEIIANVAYLRQTDHPIKAPWFRQDTSEGKCKWRFFLVANGVKLSIWAVKEKEMRSDDLSDVPNLSQVPSSVVCQSLLSAVVQVYRFVARGKDSFLDVKRFLPWQTSNNLFHYDACWYLGPSLWFTEGGVKSLMAMIADKNDLVSEEDRLTFFKDFVSSYFEILNDGAEMKAEQKAASDAVFEMINMWSDIRKKM